MINSPLIGALRAVSAVLERLEIPYMIGGSVASSSRGITRATRDIDLVAQIAPEHAGLLSAGLGPDWYADVDQIREAVLADRSFNLIHIPTSQKIDIFPANDAFGASQLQRATRATLDFLGESQTYPVASAEDILLAKLQWYRDGGEVSDREWSDITGIVAVNPVLERQYLEAWATRLGIRRLLARALADPGREP